MNRRKFITAAGAATASGCGTPSIIAHAATPIADG